jgi:radical SAM protein with 4Fe4S-binding SPASM domain
MADEGVPRICFYHLVYSGRGAELASKDLGHDETRAVVDQIIAGAVDLHKRGLPAEVLTVDNHCDGPYLYLRMLRENNPRAAGVLDLLKMNGGNSTGVGIGCVSWDGTVYPDQFWRNHPLGNVRERPFSKIWTDLSHPLLGKLKEKKQHVTGRCARCRFLDVCGGNFRARAEAATGDLWAPDPACYLTDEEIGLV